MENIYRIALGMIPGVGNIGAKRVLSHAGSAEKVFRLNRNELTGINGIGSFMAGRILDRSVFNRAREELDYMAKNNIQCLFIDDESGYPELLKFCPDSPVVLYVRGKLDVNGRKTLSIVGTRRPSPWE